MQQAGVAADAAALRRLHDVTREMVAAETRQEVYDTATAAASDLLGFEYNTIREYDADRDVLVPAAASPALVDQGGERRTYVRGESVQWRALETGDPVCVQSVADLDDDVERTGDGSMLVVPLGEWGVLSLGSGRPLTIEASDRELARVLGANLETAVERVDRMQAAREREATLREKNERLDRFNGLVAHEFRNPINIASGHLSAVEGAPGDAEHLDAAQYAVDRLDRLTESILDLVRNDDVRGAVEPLAVGPLCERVFAVVAPASASLTVVAPVTVVANPTRMQTLLENLLGNAVEHGGPSVCVRVGPLDGGGFFVADDGPGFDVANPDDLLSYRASGGSTSTGLGLAIVRDIARAHDWSVSLGESRDGGARVEVATDHPEAESAHD